MVTDRSLLNLLKSKNAKNKDDSDKTKINQLEYVASVAESKRRTVPKGTTPVGGKTNEEWSYDKKYDDTSSLYRRNYRHLGLWSRISRNSGGSLPKQIQSVSGEEILSSDRNTVESYLTVSRGIRKCCLAVFAAASQKSSTCLGFIKNHSQRSYSCKPISVSVKELSKDTHAGTPTLGRKNDENVQKLVIKQVRDILRKPTSYNIINKNSASLHDSLDKMYTLPELIFHRFQAVYDSVKDICVEKSRIVWCVPYTIVALENYFFGNIIKAVKDNSLLSPIAYYPIGLTNFQIGQRSVGTLRNEYKFLYYQGLKNYKVYSLDFSKFDSTIVSWAKDLFFSTMRALLDLDQNQSRVFDYLRVYVKYTPFVYKDKVLFKEKGISSGLLITNLFDTYWNITIHFFVSIVQDLYPENIPGIFSETGNFENMYFDKSKVEYESLLDFPSVRVLGDDTIILCDEETLALHKRVCELLGMSVTVKHIAHHPDDDIFFLGRYWNSDNRPFQTEEYMALRIVYTKWYDDKKIPFHLKDLHLYRILSICLPLLGGKEFIDKYLFDYPPYISFIESKEGFIYIKDFLDTNFQFFSFEKAQDVDSY